MLLAVAMTVPSLTTEKMTPWKSPKLVATNQAILSLYNSSRDENHDSGSTGESWTSLNFSDIDKSHAGQLSDDDIQGVLICIDGVNRLKELSLAGCVNIMGSGLKPLWGLKVLEQIDLNLVKHNERPKLVPEPRLSQESVIPILISIIDTPNSSLRCIQLPYKFVVSERPCAILNRYDAKYAAYLDVKGHKCPECG